MTSTVSLKFLDWQPLYEEEKPFQIFINIPPDAADQRSTNLVFEDVNVEIQDVRGALNNALDLDSSGFQFEKHHTAVTDFTNREVVDSLYLPEIEALIREKVSGVDRVFFFDWRPDKASKKRARDRGEVIDLNKLTSWLRPAMHVHIDQSPLAALNRIRLQLPGEADHLLRGRVRIINAWRPLIDCVEDWPLAVCDGSTVRNADLVECDHVRRHYMGSTMYLKSAKEQKFYYMSKQGKDDVLLFKQFDSRRNIKGKFAPHASFKNPTAAADATPRQSIEVRAFVFTYPDE
ncbi:methyltransferase CmcJ [Cadophora sp. DSE1049]|nr:methyltransferase CmcJ [Cadophora sp. DSE1049]